MHSLKQLPYFRYLRILAANLLLLEALFLLSYKSGLLLSEDIYQEEWFKTSERKKLRYIQNLGWDNQYPQFTRTSEPFGEVCGAAFGDSFTHGDEVSEEQSWSYKLSKLLGCTVLNFGVGGYGQDQSLLKYSTLKPDSKFVIMGLTSPMLTRNFSASWLFFKKRKNALPKPFFTLTKNNQLRLHQAPSVITKKALKEHHQLDRYYEPYHVYFPYSYSIGKIAWYRFLSQYTQSYRLYPRPRAWLDEDSINLSIAITRQFVSEITENGSIPVFLILPQANNIYDGRSNYRSYLERLKKAVTGLCIVDPFYPLRLKHEEIGSLHMPERHYNETAHQVVAEVLYKDIQQCQIDVRNGQRGEISSVATSEDSE